jgi:hypothetical protein
MAQPKWLDKPETTRGRSDKQENRITKDVTSLGKSKGRTAINSGATFGQNDVFNDELEIEAKTTYKDSYSLKVSELNKLKRRTKDPKIPIFVVEFDKSDKKLAQEYAVIEYSILIELLKNQK